MIPAFAYRLAVLVAIATVAVDAQVVVVETVPAGATVEVDGRAVGAAPVAVSTASRSVRVRASLALYDAVEEDVEVDRDTVVVRLRLSPSAGAVRLVGIPPEATVETVGWTVEGEVSRVAPGITTVRVRMPRQPDLFARVPVEPLSETVVEYAEGFGTRGFAANFLLPGSSQIAHGRGLAGVAYALGTAGALGGAFVVQGRVSDADGDLEAAAEDYRAARSEAAVLEARARIDQAYEQGRDARALRTGVLLAAGAVYVASIVDGAVHYGRQPELRVGPPTPSRWTLGVTDTGVAARLSL